MIKPAKLNTGDAVGIISPAGPVSRDDLDPGLRFLEDRGFAVHAAAHVHDRSEYLAGKDEDRLSDLEEMFLNHEIRAIFCSRGGYGTLRLLNRIDYDLIRENPKILLGYSDITALLLAVTRRTGLITFHGPMVKGLSELPEKAWDTLIKMVSSDEPVAFSPMAGYPLTGGEAKGRLMGGNLSLLCRLLGTPYMPDLKGCILFIEDRGEALYRLDRMLTHLALSGHLDGIRGLIVGHFTGCGEPAAVDALIKERFGSLNIPIAAGFPLGHCENNTTLPLGITAELDTHAMKLVLLESTVV